MDLETAIRTRRTHKAYRPEPLGREVLDELFELARATTDPPSRDELYREIHRTFVEVCPAVVLLHRRDYILHSQHVDGLQLYPLLPTVRPIDLWLTGQDRG